MMFDNLMLLAALFAIFYFILLRPQQKRVKAHQELIKSLSKGQKIITTGGLMGTIAKLEGEHVVVVEVAQGVKVRISRAAVSEVVTGDSASGEIANDN
ncbi:MAG: preprotein translocase subunit YajC [Alphaproteobacteria bacterium]|nr:preprotein translocase subunit YajC [Alphaproteobacteria bacterium]